MPLIMPFCASFLNAQSNESPSLALRSARQSALASHCTKSWLPSFFAADLVFIPVGVMFVTSAKARGEVLKGGLNSP